MITLSLWPILAAGVASTFIGFVWYHEQIFGTAWARMSNISPEMLAEGKKKAPLKAVIALVFGMLIAYILTFFAAAWGVYDTIGAIELAFWIWLGFVAPMMFGMVLWESKPFSLYLIHVGHWLVTLICIALIIVLGFQMGASKVQSS